MPGHAERALIRRRMPLALGALAIGLVADQISKWLVLTLVMVPPRTIEVLPFFNLTLGFNTGVSFGMLREAFLDRALLLAAIALVIAMGMLLWATHAEKRIETFALGLIAGGALGNVIDRVRQGAVTDFLDFHIGGWHWPAFNLADVAITIGAICLVVGTLYPARSRGPAERHPTEMSR